jgi:(4S)-4-hydroxy-5-phosphonooxypentane-2,3-dione isomerase
MRTMGRTDGRYAIIVDFDLLPGAYDAFMSALVENAETSVRSEPGCYRFDVLTPRKGDTSRVTLYEIYTDRGAFDEHLRTPHFLTFKDSIAGLVQRQAVIEFDVSENAKAA